MRIIFLARSNRSGEVVNLGLTNPIWHILGNSGAVRLCFDALRAIGRARALRAAFLPLQDPV